MRVGGQRHAPATLPPVQTRYPLYRVGPQGRCGQVRKISPPPEFDPRTVQPAASRYTDWAIPAHRYWSRRQNTQKTNRSTSQRAAALHWEQQTASYRTRYDPREQSMHGLAVSNGAVKKSKRHITQIHTRLTESTKIFFTWQQWIMGRSKDLHGPFNHLNHRPSLNCSNHGSLFQRLTVYA